MRLRLVCVLLSFCLAAPWLAFASEDHDDVRARLEKGLWDAHRAMNDIAVLLSFGPRVPDMPGHEQALQYIEAEMHKTKAANIQAQQWVEAGDANVLHQWLGSGARQHTMANIVVRFFPEKKRRIIIGTHYDSIIRAYADQPNPKGVMPGANNSASGVALLLETARVIDKLPEPPVGIDFIFFDGEEGPLSLGAGDPNWHAIGSPYFASRLTDFYPEQKPEQAILFDMVCAKKMALKQEPLSIASARAEVEKFWDIGNTYSTSIFKKASYGFPIYDDQGPLGELGIPSFLVIGFEYDPWFNTTQDTIDKCSETNVKALGDTLVDYIYSLDDNGSKSP